MTIVETTEGKPSRYTQVYQLLSLDPSDPETQAILVRTAAQRETDLHQLLDDIEAVKRATATDGDAE